MLGPLKRAGCALSVVYDIAIRWTWSRSLVAARPHLSLGPPNRLLCPGRHLWCTGQ